MNTRKTALGVLIGGILWLVFVLTMPVFLIVPRIGPFQPDSVRHGWAEMVWEQVLRLTSAVLGYLLLLCAISLPVGIGTRLARRRAAFKRPSTPAPHGKYLPWGRNLRRHAAIPARYNGLRPRKSLRSAQRSSRRQD